MCPKERTRFYPVARMGQKGQFDHVAAAIAGFVDLNNEKVKDDFESCMFSFHSTRNYKPYRVSGKRQTLKAAKLAFKELLVALSRLDYETQRKLETYESKLGEQATRFIAEGRHRLHHMDLIQDLIRMRQIWVEAIDLNLKELPSKGIVGRDRRPDKVQLIEDLKEFFAEHGRVRRQKTRGEQRLSFVNEVLKALNESTVQDLSELKRTQKKRKYGGAGVTKKPG
jgi:hypothetical protein